MHPLRPRLGQKATICIVVVIWAAASGVAAPNFIFFTTEVVPLQDGQQRIVCYAQWPDGDQSESQMEYIHSIIVIVLTYIIPMSSMAFTYTQMGLMLWGSQGIGELTTNQSEAMKSKRKVVKMMIVVVTIFGVCWLPFHMYFILYTQFPEINNYKYIQEIYLAIYWLAMSNSMYNPMIYCWLNGRFRDGFKRVLSLWCPCVRCFRAPSSRKRSNVNHTNFSMAITTHEEGNDRTLMMRSFYRGSTMRCHSVLTTDPTKAAITTRRRGSEPQTMNGGDTNPHCLAPNGLQAAASGASANV